MRLSELLAELPEQPHWVRGDASESDPVIRGVCVDSRAVAPGDLFIALRGHQVDGHRFVAQALALGAAAVLVEELAPEIDLRGHTALRVPDSRRALAPIATRFFGSPASELTLVGVTGTNGKTSVTYLCESILRAAGRRPGVIGTVGHRFEGETQRSLNTTPDSLDLQQLLRSMRTRGSDSAVLEVSSHGLTLGRVDGCRFAVGAFTNLTQDHLDFHGSMEAYGAAKALLFSNYLVPGGAAVVNVDDPAGELMCAAARGAGARVLRLSRSRSDAEIRLIAADVRMDGTSARVLLPSGPLDLALPLVGDFQLENALVACGVGTALGIASGQIAEGIARCPQVPGRVERVETGELPAPTVLVDYAHTPDALDKVLRTLGPLARGRLVTVFGCGGDRDKTKRPRMAECAARASALVIATSDNPRTEEPVAILADVERGLGALPRVEPEALARAERAYSIVVDRRAAIELAVQIAKPEDVVLIAGKGHEDYQIIGREKLPFSDRDEARRALARRAA
jgi:UDP-N-acetylmuramoyl-L-alanyl-D-glutamate--2,6-diaminopimelate ligase